MSLCSKSTLFVNLILRAFMIYKSIYLLIPSLYYIIPEINIKLHMQAQLFNMLLYMPCLIVDSHTFGVISAH